MLHMPAHATVPVAAGITSPVLPDWHKNHVVVADPAIWSFYRKRPHDLRPVYGQLLNAFRSLGVSYTVLTKEDSPVDIWLRDWGPIENCYFGFRPSYAKGWYSARSIAKGRRKLDRRRSFTPRRIPLVLDGGNLVHNGRVAIVTGKIWRDNRHFSRREIERAIINIGFEQVIVIPVEPGDKVGHADGIVRFLQSDILLMNDYNDPAFRRYSTELLRRLRSSLPRVRIAPFPWFFEMYQRNGIWSAVGCYINFNLTKNGIVYPIFDHRLDDSVAATLSELSRLPARAVSATALARLGGGLNCITL
jgi:agmatine deiminase